MMPQGALKPERKSMETNQYLYLIEDLKSRSTELRGYL